ncbi:two-component system sensor histidine kinase CreC [Marilutibacter chinensis]|uniref:histidine kinase n=1 Tax=Marilutibacter chinensis TaxID=2912247 RepID=A0ABS9HYH6_9GAMM|nr:two-component system sensor histidine kinase CreC [Lysobacter chinensis]MCF7223428.1 two-component system sensor histidine kinase CreC [Lysobacter chinensis]
MKIGLRIFLGYFLIVALAAMLLARVFLAEVKPGVRQAMEDTLVDSANVLAELATDDFLAGRINDGTFAARIRALDRRDLGAEIWGFGKRVAQYRIYITDARGIVVFDSNGRDLGKDYSRWNDVYLTLRGRYGARSSPESPDAPDSTVMHVAAPIRDADGRIVGSLTVAKPNRTIAPFIARSQRVVLAWGLLLLGVALAVGIIAAWWLSRQLRGLQRYARAVTAGERAVPPKSSGEFRALGEALETMRARLEGKQYVEQYVHTLTHEMKSPLAAIRGSAELLEGAPPSDGGEAAVPMAEADRARFAANIRHQSERLAQMIDKLLALASVEHRQRLDNPQPLALEAVLAEAVEAARPGLERAGISCRLRLEDASSGANAPRVPGDAFLLRQAVLNLIENAADFAPRGSGIEVAVEHDGGGVRIEVRDRGAGIPGYALDRVFERFYSLARPDGGSRSSGLGLSFVAEVAALHRGRAALANRDGGGAVASLWLPLSS